MRDYSKTLVVNYFAGPGSGKSTLMADTFARLKWLGIECEMAPEYVKELVWEGQKGPWDQEYLEAQQKYRINRLLGKVKVVLTDSPLLMMMAYRPYVDRFDPIVDYFNMYRNLNIFVRRKKVYSPNGRVQTRAQALNFDKTIYKLMTVLTPGETQYEFDGVPTSAPKIVKVVQRHLKEHTYA
jgi:hypothetical protein